MLKRMKVVIKMVKIVWGLEKYQGSSETLKRIYLCSILMKLFN